MVLLGKTIFNDNSRSVVKLYESDEKLVEQFCKECKIQNFQNNSSLEKMKWNWCLENGSWFAGIKDDKIYTIAGYHKLEENSYRVLFRGAQLPNHNPNIVSKNIFNTMVHWTYLLYEQIQEILSIDQDAKIYISTNVNQNKDAPSSYKLSRSMAPLLTKKGLLILEKENIDLFYTKQNLWLLNINEYIKQRQDFLINN